MNAEPPNAQANTVSRRRYERERRARKEVEELLEKKARELFEANAELRQQAQHLEQEVQRRTLDLESAKNDAVRASDAKSAFLAMISHEIRTPLNGLLGMGTALYESGLTEEQSEIASVMLQSGDTLLSLLNDILDLSKIEARQMEVENIAFDLAKLAEETFLMFSLQAEQKGLAFTLDIDPNARCSILGDPTRVRQVVSNLLSNAIKFTPAGRIDMTLRIEAGQAWFCVSDSGTGVAPEQEQNLFKPFSQTDQSITRKFGGTGLGLAIAREISRLMGGDLIYQPRPEGGAQFIATIAAQEAPKPSIKSSSAFCEYEAILTGRPWRVLAAEDNLTNQKVLGLMLRRYNLQISMVADGAAAVAAHCSNPFDIVLMDVNMPEMNGLEAAGFIRQFEAARDLPRVPIIALTANAMTHQVQDYLRQGIDAHVAKPIKRETLASAMARLLCAGKPEGWAAKISCRSICPVSGGRAACDQAECAPSAKDLTKDST